MILSPPVHPMWSPSTSCLEEVVMASMAKTPLFGDLLLRRRPIFQTRRIRDRYNRNPTLLFDSSSLGTRKGACCARRRVRYDEDDGSDDEDYGYNSDIAMLESFSDGNRQVALLVRASVDGEQEEVLIFKGFSSLLSSRTFSNPSKSVLPARATITSIDIVKGPFDPSMVEYLETNLTLEEFERRHKQKNAFIEPPDPSPSPSRFRGVTCIHDEKWCAKIFTYHYEICLGTFEDEEYAALAYDRVMMKLGACRASLNFQWPDHPTLELQFQSIYSITSLLNLTQNKTYDLLFTVYIQSTRSIWGPPVPSGMSRRVDFRPEVVLLQKELTLSDVGVFNRLVIPKRYALMYFPNVRGDPVLADVGTMLSLVDKDSFVWPLCYKYWKSSKTFVITRGWNVFMRNKGLKAGDIFIFYWKDHACRVDVIYRNRGDNINGNAVFFDGAEEFEIDDYAGEEVSDEVEELEERKRKKMRLFGVDVR